MAVQRGIDKWRLKKWFSVRAPKEFNDATVGEMPANDEKAVVGRHIVVGLDVLTHNQSHAYTSVTLKVISVSGEAAQTRLVKIELVSSYIRSLVRHYRSVSSAVVPVSTRDGTKVIVKLIAVTRARTAHTKIVGLRKEMVEFTQGYFRENDVAPIISSIMDGKFQDALSNKLKHITDLNKIEVRKLEIND